MLPESVPPALNPRAIGRGSLQWWTRVECYIERESDELREFVWERLNRILPGEGEEDGGWGLDWGTGSATPVIGMTFLVLADSPGEAAGLAVSTGLEALGSYSIRLYGFTLVSEPPFYDDSEYPIIDD